MGSIEFLEKDNPDILAYRRQYEDEAIIVLSNLTCMETEFPADPVWDAPHPGQRGQGKDVINWYKNHKND